MTNIAVISVLDNRTLLDARGRLFKLMLRADPKSTRGILDKAKLIDAVLFRIIKTDGLDFPEDSKIPNINGYEITSKSITRLPENQKQRVLAVEKLRKILMGLRGRVMLHKQLVEKKKIGEDVIIWLQEHEFLSEIYVNLKKTGHVLNNKEAYDDAQANGEYVHNETKYRFDVAEWAKAYRDSTSLSSICFISVQDTSEAKIKQVDRLSRASERHGISVYLEKMGEHYPEHEKLLNKLSELIGGGMYLKKEPYLGALDDQADSVPDLQTGH